MHGSVGILGFGIVGKSYLKFASKDEKPDVDINYWFDHQEKWQTWPQSWLSCCSGKA